MKLKLLNSRHFFIFLCIILQACDGQKAQIVIFDKKVTLSSEIAKCAHDQPFLDLIKIKKLHYNCAANLSSKEIYNVASAALSKTKTKLKAEDVLLMLFFTMDKEGSVKEITVENTHAFSAFSYRNNILEHRYFEKQHSQTFTEIPSLSTTLKAGFSNDDIRMLHFAAIGKNGFPARSTIYEFNMQINHKRRNSQQVDNSIRIALLLDNERYWGASINGLYGEELQTVLMPPDGGPDGGNHCGHNNRCPLGPHPCGQDDIASPEWVCKPEGNGCCFAAMAILLKETGQFPDVSIDFRKLWNFRSEFLLKYDLGRDYVASYMLLSIFKKPNNESLEMVVATLPHLYNAIDIIMSDKSEDADSIVVTPLLFQMGMDLIESVRHIEDLDFQNVLNRLENDLKEFQGLSKKELVKIFETRPSFSLKKKAMQVK